MKIVLLYLGRKGAGPVYTIEFAKALLVRNCELFVVVSSCSDNIEDWRNLQHEYGFAYKEVKTYNNKTEFCLNSFNLLQYYRICKAINQFTPHFVLSTMTHPWHNIIYSFLKKGIVRVKVIHDVIPHTGEDSCIQRLFNWMDIHISDYWITLTRKSKEALVGKGIDENRIGIIPHANFSFYKNNSDISYNENKLYNKIAFFGRINKYKGVDVLLNAFAKVKLHLPNLKLLIAGNGDCTAYGAFFDEHKDALELHVRWIEDDEIASLLVDTDLVIIPYIEATQSGVIPLAYALGKPVVATCVGGIPEQVPSKCGILIPPNDAEAIANAILTLYSDTQKMSSMGKNALKYAEEELSWDKSAQLLLDFYNNNCC